MALQIIREEIWAAEIDDRAGGLAEVLGQLADGGADLQAVLARRQPEKPGTGVTFVAGIKGRKPQDAARSAGFSPADSVVGLRIEGPDKPGLGARLTCAIADAGVSMRGLSASVMGNKFVAHLSFDSEEEANRAAKAIKSVNGARPRQRTARRPRRRAAGRR